MSDYLIITTSGGGGHITAANAIQHHKRQKSPDNRVYQLDMMRSGCSYGESIGKKCTDLWDDAQKNGDVVKQKNLIFLQPIAEAFFFLGTFFTLLNQLLKFEKLPKKVICTQPLHLFAITLAVRFANWIRYKEGKKITHVDLHLTDLPTHHAKHFLGGLCRLHALSQKSFDMMRVHTPKSVNEDSDYFWKEHAYLKPEQIKYEPLPVGEDYNNVDALPLPRTSLEISISSNCEKYNIRGNDKVGLIMLGTNPEREAILAYLDEIIKEGLKSKSLSKDNDSAYYFFIACGKAEYGKSTNPLYEEVMDKIGQANLPPRIKIVPFINQPLSPIFARSDLTITRSGGMTSAEIIALKQRKEDKKRVFIHSPIKEKIQDTLGKPETNPSLIMSRLIDGIPLWENGNALYLYRHKEVRASIITPEYISEELDLFFKERKLSLDLLKRFENTSSARQRGQKIKEAT